MYSKRSTRFIEPGLWALKAYNESLEGESSSRHLNEDFLESKRCELNQIKPDRSEAHGIYWLTYARLFELALLCAGNYADHFEFAAAGDLLVNPRLILIHFRNGCNPVKKNRHKNLTEQFRYVAGEREAVVRWLKCETFPEIVEKPLLVHMQEEMAGSGYLSKAYLDLAQRRMNRIADAIGFLASWHVAENSAFYLRVQSASPAEQSFIESNLCRFDKRVFIELGQEARRLVLNPCVRSRFLDRCCVSCRREGSAAAGRGVSQRLGVGLFPDEKDL